MQKLKAPPVRTVEQKCPKCNGTGFPVVRQPVESGRKIYPARCQTCQGKGRITVALPD